ncbi:hypothetical protein [Nitrosomonas sp. Nm58]|jgi:uncharacterized protein YaaW (UPF0174 family)|uniref:hypothetical protein n=1 Tax=Nitrosomonas sp. Nm58 TaxID=200126 RepID=UPI000899E5E3|nr:hypothetical protein [Nitrosomonas sp. Nm58]SDZ16452.1 Uncharacterized protein YaaW, UPF0174 family [Nitrosomonas sp. Nm58]
MGYGDIIFARLRKATKEEKAEICKALRIPITEDIHVISKEYRSAAGHSFRNIFRKDHELPYKKILIDVADKLKPGVLWTFHKYDDDTPEERIEEEIEEYLFDRVQKELKKLTVSERKKKEEELKKGFEKEGYSQVAISSIMTMLASGTVGAVVAPRVALYFASSTSASIFGVSSSSILLSSTGIGLLVSIPLLVGAMGGPAYRKTILATIQMIRIRKRLEGEALL